MTVFITCEVDHNVFSARTPVGHYSILNLPTFGIQDCDGYRDHRGTGHDGGLTCLTPV